MSPERILEMVDRTIIQSFKEGNVISDIQSQLNTRRSNFLRVLLKDETINVEKIMSTDWVDLPSSKIKYGVYYIKNCNKRIEDLDWILLNKERFPNKNYSQIFSLLKLRDKLSK
jgi:predicted site-specific integrase-resolvase